MLFKELPVGSLFNFVTPDNDLVSNHIYFYTRSSEYESDRMIWLKYTADNMCICLNGVRMTYMTNPMENGKNRIERTHGTPIFYNTDIYKLLNSEHLDTPINGFQQGFLSLFNSEEYDMLLPIVREIETPTGYTRQYGPTLKYQSLVSLPVLDDQSALSRLFDITHVANVGTIHGKCNGQYAVIRSTLRGNYYYNKESYNADRRMFYNFPVVKIKEDAPFVMYNDSDPLTYYSIVGEIPEMNFNFSNDLSTVVEVA